MSDAHSLHVSRAGLAGVTLHSTKISLAAADALTNIAVMHDDYSIRKQRTDGWQSRLFP